MSAIPKGSRVLVTGANGYLGAEVVNQLLLAEYIVRGTVRSEAKGQWLTDFFGHKFGEGRLEIAVVPEMAREGAYDQAIKGVAGVVHIASDLSESPDPNIVVAGSIKGAVNAVEAATAEPAVKCFVLTSSAFASNFPNPTSATNIDENTWNTGAVEAAWAPPPYERSRAAAVYAASKVGSEQAVWKFVREKKPGFVFNAVLPGVVFGRLLCPGKQNASTGGWVTGLYKEGGLAAADENPPEYFIDVQDVARLHVAALTDPDIQNERIFGSAEPWNWNTLLGILRRHSPGHVFPADLPNHGNDQSVILPAQRAEEILRRNYGHGFTGLEESVKATVAHMT